ncbi:hypothetical protein LCGC14_1436090, partial [marine sediment metagenome]
TRLTDGSPDKMEELAKALVLTVKNPENIEGQPPATPPDPGSNIGGVVELTPDRAEEMTGEEYADHPSNKDRFK